MENQTGIKLAYILAFTVSLEKTGSVLASVKFAHKNTKELLADPTGLAAASVAESECIKVLDYMEKNFQSEDELEALKLFRTMLGL